MRISIYVSEALSNGYFQERNFFLSGQLDPKIYKETNTVIEALGGKWNRSAKAHVFSEGTQKELEDAMKEVIGMGECTTIAEIIKKTQYYPTPLTVVKKLVELADIRKSDSVLEPSAGDGAIASEITKVPHASLTLVEFDNKHSASLARKCPGATTVIKDFMAFVPNGKFDKIVMNPPFSKSQDAKHIIHAYSMLAPGWTLVAVASSSVKDRAGAVYDKLRSLGPVFKELPSWAFRDSGTMVNTVIVVLKK